MARHLENVKEELLEEENPDEGNIGKWLDKASGALNVVDKESELYTKAKEVFVSFGMEL